MFNMVVVALAAASLTVSWVGGPSMAGQESSTIPGLQAVTALASSALDRLEIADDVAASKFLSGKAVDDPAREQAVIDATVAAAKAENVDPVAAERIIRAQISASKEVQYSLIARWRDHPSEAPTTAPDLATQVRPRINAVDARLLSELRGATVVLDGPGCRHLVKVARAGLDHDLDKVHREGLRTALSTFCSTSS